jgi:hypothetical protein
VFTEVGNSIVSENKFVKPKMFHVFVFGRILNGLRVSFVVMKCIIILCTCTLNYVLSVFVYMISYSLCVHTMWPHVRVGTQL